MAKNRVKQRVDQGGHGISDTDIERRYYESLQNLKKVLPLSDIVTIYDNTHKLTMIAVFCKGECVWSSKTKPQWYIDLGIG